MSGDEDLFQKDVKLELSRFRTKTKPTLAEAIALRLEKADLDKKTDADKLKQIDLRLKKLTDGCSKEASSSCASINPDHAAQCRPPTWYCYSATPPGPSGQAVTGARAWASASAPQRPGGEALTPTI